MIYLVRIRKPLGPLRAVALRPALRPTQRVIRLHRFERRPSLPAAPPAGPRRDDGHDGHAEHVVRVETHDAAAATRETREEPRKDAQPADDQGKQQGAADNRGERQEAAAVPDDSRGAAVVRGEERGPVDRRDELREKSLAASNDDYKELTAVWRYLGARAQATVAIAGIFIAATFVHLSRYTPAGLAEVVVLFFAVLSLIVCAFLSLLVLRVQDMPSPVLDDFLRRWVTDLEGKSDEEFRAALPSFYKERAELWSRPTEQLGATLKRQSALLWGAQVFLVVAILAAALLVIAKLLTSG